jgi:hypothetical protein
MKFRQIDNSIRRQAKFYTENKIFNEKIRGYPCLPSGRHSIRLIRVQKKTACLGKKQTSGWTVHTNQGR